jgi:hypothetical protein
MQECDGIDALDHAGSLVRLAAAKSDSQRVTADGGLGLSPF